MSGIILQKFGAGICFLVNAASFGGVMLSIAFMKIPKSTKPVLVKKNVFKNLSEGFIYLKKESSIGLVIIMLSLTGLLVLPYDTLIPVFAKMIFRGNAATFGYITSFIGVGAVAGTVLIASLKKNASMRKVLLYSTVILSIGLICFSYTTNFPLAMFFAVITGFGGVAQFTTCNIIVQSESSPEMRGRSISILLTAIFGMLPLGSLIVGSISQRIGAQKTLLCEGIVGIIIAVVFARILKEKNKKNIAQQMNMHAAEEEEMTAEL
ncbi:MAG: MFS transporter [Arachidicoccus sp.]|nr:MFS transporter [Arachidicoccus sp.]